MYARLFLLFTLNILYFVCGAQKFVAGPYIIYKGNNTTVLSVKDSTVTKNDYTTGELKTVNISFPDQPGWNFNVPLQKTIPVQPSEYKQPEKLLAVSDLEGEFAAFRKLLLAAKVIDEKYNWTFGKGHLVFVGDFCDRGTQVTEIAWLLYLLEQKAQTHGGYVHVILGNHELMNLSNNLKYVHANYITAATIMGIPYADLFGVDTELGKWMRSKNIIEKIGQHLFVHGGVAPQVNELKLSVEQINQTTRPYYDKRLLPETASDNAKLFLSSKTSPFWYRGYFNEPFATQDDINSTLKLFNVQQIIVGHTIVPGNIGYRFDKKVIGIDVNHHKGHSAAALYTSGLWHKMDINGGLTPLK